MKFINDEGNDIIFSVKNKRKTTGYLADESAECREDVFYNGYIYWKE